MTRSLRGRVTLAVGIALVVALAVAGAVTVVAVGAWLHERTDTQLERARDTVTTALDGRSAPVLREGQLRVSLGGVQSGVVHLVTDDGVVATIASDGTVRDEPTAAELDEVGPEPAWLGGARERLRAVGIDTPGLSVTLSDGTTRAVERVVLARDVTDDDATVRRLVEVEALVGIVVGVLGGAGVWWLVGRGLRPLARMTDAAARAAAGDDDARMPRIPALAETSTLAAALDEALDRRAAAEQRVRDFVADAAHELRTPLTSVHGWADLYAHGALDTAGVDRAMERIGAETTRMRHLVEQMSLLARLDAHVGPVAEDVDLGALADAVLTDLDVLVPDRAVTWRPPDAPVVVRGDPAQLTQVVQNLVGNVLRHTPVGAALRVAVAREGELVVLEVHDDGPGLPPDVAAHAFERFVRGSGGERGGSGLGLAIVAGVVAAHGGTATLSSDPGQGTTVRVTIPAR